MKTDKELAFAYQNGEKEVFDELVKRYHTSFCLSVELPMLWT